MKTRYRLIRRGVRGGGFYFVDNKTGRRKSLRTGNEDEARQIVEAKNQAERQPVLNLQIAKAYLAGADSNFVRRTWGEVMAEFIKTRTGKNRTRYERAIADRSYDSIRDLHLIETQPEHFLGVLESGTVSTNNYLRRFHNFALDVGWLLRPVLPKRQWPPVHYREKRAITRQEHELILGRETNVEMRAFLWCCWHLGGSQSDVARLHAEDIDWESRVVSFFRSKTGGAQIVHFGAGLAEVLRGLPQSGLLFPRLAAMDEKHRASLFQRACRRVKVTGISLHSYRYAWAERAKKVGHSQHGYRFGSRTGEIEKDPALAWRILSLSQSLAGLRMLILAQCAKLFARHNLPGAQPQSFRAGADPLAGTNFPGSIVIVLRQVLDEVPFGGSQVLMGDGAEHSMGR